MATKSHANCNCLYITVVEDNSSDPERTEDLFDHETGEKIAKFEVTSQQVCQYCCAQCKDDFIYNCCTFCVGSEKRRACLRKTEKSTKGEWVKGEKCLKLKLELNDR